MSRIKKLLFVALHRPGRSPSQRFRYEQFVPFLEENGWQCDYAHLLDENGDFTFYSHGSHLKKAGVVLKGFFQRWNEIKKADDYDVIFIQRETFIAGTTIFERKFAKSKAKIAYDFDDAIWMLDISDANKHLSFLKDPSKTKKIIRLSDLVLAGNDFLAGYARQFNEQVEVIPTVVDTSYFKTSRSTQNPKVVIGWSGSQTTIKHLLEAQPWLARVVEKYPDSVEVRAICERPIVMDGVPIQVIAWERSQEVDFLDQFDIGIMPLPDDEWSKGKCGFKGIQYMSMSKPCLMSPVGVNTEIIEHGINGFLPRNNEEWVDQISALIENETMRQTIGKSGRETIVKKYSLNAVKQAFLEALDQLV